MPVKPVTVRYVTRKMFEEFGEQALIDAKKDFGTTGIDVYKSTLTYGLPHEDISRLKEIFLDSYQTALAKILRERSLNPV